MPLLKFFHVFFVFCWVGSLMTLSSCLLFQKRAGAELLAVLRKVYLSIDLPSMLLAVSLGVASLLTKEMNWKAPWLHMKLTFAFILILCDLLVGRQIVKLQQGKRVSRGWLVGLHLTLLGSFLGVLYAIYILK